MKEQVNIHETAFVSDKSEIGGVPVFGRIVTLWMMLRSVRIVI